MGLSALSSKLASATANMRAAIYYIEAAEREEKQGNQEEVKRLSSEAARRLEKVTELEFDRSPLWEKGGDLWWKAGDAGMSSRAYHNAHELQPRNPELTRKLVEATTREHFDPESPFNQRPYSIHVFRALTALDYGAENRDELAERAITEVKAYLEAEKDDPDALLELSRLKRETGDLDGAIEIYERILDCDPENKRVARFLVLAYAEKGHDEKAYGILKDAQTEPDGFHPRVSNPDVRRAWNFAEEGDFGNAIIHMEKALQYKPDDIVNWEHLEYYHAATNQHEKAEKCRKKLQSLCVHET